MVRARKKTKENSPLLVSSDAPASDVIEVSPEEETEEPLVELATVSADEVASEDDDSTETDTALVPYDSLQRYLAEIRRYPLLTPEEEHQLAVRYKEHGDVEAAYRLVTANLRLVVMFARKYERAVHNLLDLIQEGSIG